MKLSLLLFLLGFIAIVVDARLDLTTIITQEQNNEGCCNDCECSSSTFPPCRCNDAIGRNCRPGCDSCVCESGLPPTCRCEDYIYSCNKCINSKDGAN